MRESDKEKEKLEVREVKNKTVQEIEGAKKENFLVLNSSLKQTFLACCMLFKSL